MYDFSKFSSFLRKHNKVVIPGALARAHLLIQPCSSPSGFTGWLLNLAHQIKGSRPMGTKSQSPELTIPY